MFKSKARFANRVVTSLVLFELCLIIAYWIDILIGEPEPFHRLVNLDGEANIPAWFSSSQLLFGCLVAWITGLLQSSRDRPSGLFLFMIGLCFIFMSVDETAQLHEGITGIIGTRYVDWLPTFLLTHKEIIALLLILALAGLRFMWRDLKAIWRWSRRESILALTGMCVFLLGAAGIETLGYKFLQLGSLVYKVEVTIEEFMEMFGASLVVYAALSFAQHQMEKSRVIRFGRKAARRLTRAA
ncbi:MAG TPA: hypothetical protein VLR90_13200 [Blastocatellia bacterium]|nr:hypothetical protein [Blastocatellia bacterium]